MSTVRQYWDVSEAGKKWCPFVRWARGTTITNRRLQPDGKIDPFFACLGLNCAVWIVADTRDKKTGKLYGCCGLTGDRP